MNKLQDELNLINKHLSENRKENESLQNKIDSNNQKMKIIK